MTREEKMKRIAERFIEQSQVAIHNDDGSITVLSLENGKKIEHPKITSNHITFPEEKSKSIRRSYINEYQRTF